MRTPLHTRLICCWLAIVVLVSSTGFGMIEHWCQMRGHTKTLLIADNSCPRPCQADESPAPVSGRPSVRKLPCCKTSLSYHHLEVSRCVADHNPLPSLLTAEFIPYPQFRFLTVTQVVSSEGEPTRPVADPPTHRGRFRLALGCTWLI